MQAFVISYHFFFFSFLIQTLYVCEQGCQSPTALGCLNGGSCVADDRKQTFSCLCKAPWSGKSCEKLGKKTFQEQHLFHRRKLISNTSLLVYF